MSAKKYFFLVQAIVAFAIAVACTVSLWKERKK